MIKDTLYAKYLTERARAKVIETESGFITYRINGEECFIQDMYLLPEARRSGACRELIDQLKSEASSCSCKFITGNIFVDDPGCNQTIQAACGLGFRIRRAEAGVVLICLDIIKGD